METQGTDSKRHGASSHSVVFFPDADDDWMLVKYLEDHSYWIVPAFYMAGYGNWRTQKQPLDNVEVPVYNGPDGVCCSGCADTKPILEFRLAKIFCVKETPCCALRVYILGEMMDREGIDSQVIQNITMQLTDAVSTEQATSVAQSGMSQSSQLDREAVYSPSSSETDYDFHETSELKEINLSSADTSGSKTDFEPQDTDSSQTFSQTNPESKFQGILEMETVSTSDTSVSEMDFEAEESDSFQYGQQFW